MSLEDSPGPLAFEDPAEAQWLANRESPEFQAYSAELYRRMSVHAQRAQEFVSGEPGSPEFWREVGKFWWERRTVRGLSRYSAAEIANLDANSIRFLEVGLPEDNELTPTFLSAYANALGDPRIYEAFQEQFSLPNQGETPK